MASRYALPEEELICPVCWDILTDPVILTCSHSFCKTCVQRSWKDKQFRECPVCRQRFVLAELPCNRALKNLCENLKQQKSQRCSRSEVVCSLHSEKLKLFCLEHQEPICLVCRDSRKHTSHHFVPVEEAAQDHRKELHKAQSLSKYKMEMIKGVKQTCDETADHIKTQADNTERNIKKEFKKLHQFLQEEEGVRIAALREEEKQKKEKIKEKIERMNRSINSLSAIIKVIEEDLRADDVSVLQNIKASKGLPIRFQVTLPKPKLVSGALIDVAKHLGNLTFRVWEKMKEVVKFTLVILDPNTTHPCLALSNDLTRATNTGAKQQLPDNPERFTMHPIVLGSEGFSSGKHSWQVEVGDHRNWVIGVVGESIDRKEAITEVYAPEDIIWCIHHRSGKYTNGLGETLHLNRPQRIRVHLDCDRQEVSFYDPEDMSYSHNIWGWLESFRFPKKIYPFFSIGLAGNAKQSVISSYLVGSCPYAI